MLFEGQSISCQLISGGIAELCFNSQQESVNKFDQSTLNEFRQVVDTLKTTADLKAVLVTSEKNVFIVGADIKEFLDVFKHPEQQIQAWIKEANDIFNDFEDLQVPTAVAINGIALGGGLEMCLCCDFRIASENGLVGVPETQLGLIPGFGGTTRLPRLIGSDNAVEWISTGKHFKAAAAMKVGVVDAVVSAEILKDAAIDTLNQAIAGDLDWQARRKQRTSPLQLNTNEALMSFSTCKAMVGAKAGRNYPAPMAAIDVIEKSASLGRNEALEIEGAAFAKLAKTSAATSLIGLFLNDQELKRSAKIAAKTADITVKSAAVLGAGIMGGGIAYQSASKGFPIVMKDIRQEALDLGMSTATKILNKGVSLGKLSSAKMAETLTRIKPTLNYADLAGTDVVIEAVIENPAIKDAVLQETEALIDEDVILTSNTSTISIDLLATNLKRPEKFCGMHFFNPVNKMKLVEVIRGSKTSDQTVAATVAFASALGKTPVVVNDCPGFLVNRVLFPYFKGFSMLIRDGANFQQIDKIMEQFGWPMGPAYLVDVIGLDTGHHAETVLAEGFPDRMGKLENDIVSVLYEAERFGAKNGKGFYSYGKDKRGRPTKVVDDQIQGFIDSVSGPAKEFSREEIVNRMMIPMIIETIRCYEEKVVATVAEIDMGLIYGIGFPPFRGGALRYADSIGMKDLCTMADQYSDLGPAYHVTDKMRSMAEQGETFY
ncbi:MAG: fatty acid oxidation complex subunit alpha FadB [Gammaproteobacteria bacterium]|nr:MAG: fatty acid oxidation complex subunit alpha FadB [Gammaproteobacteria bacterium]